MHSRLQALTHKAFRGFLQFPEYIKSADRVWMPVVCSSFKSHINNLSNFMECKNE